LFYQFIRRLLETGKVINNGRHFGNHFLLKAKSNPKPLVGRSIQAMSIVVLAQLIADAFYSKVSAYLDKIGEDVSVVGAKKLSKRWVTAQIAFAKKLMKKAGNTKVDDRLEERRNDFYVKFKLDVLTQGLVMFGSGSDTLEMRQVDFSKEDIYAELSELRQRIEQLEKKKTPPSLEVAVDVHTGGGSVTGQDETASPDVDDVSEADKATETGQDETASPDVDDVSGAAGKATEKEKGDGSNEFDAVGTNKNTTGTEDVSDDSSDSDSPGHVEDQDDTTPDGNANVADTATLGGIEQKTAESSGSIITEPNTAVGVNAVRVEKKIPQDPGGGNLDGKEDAAITKKAKQKQKDEKKKVKAAKVAAAAEKEARREANKKRKLEHDDDRKPKEQKITDP
jgi:hypothetical protein